MKNLCLKSFSSLMPKYLHTYGERKECIWLAFANKLYINVGLTC